MPTAVTTRASEIGPDTVVNFVALEPAHRLHDADHGAEQTDERRRGTDRAEHPQADAQILVHPEALAVDRGGDMLRLGPAEPLVAHEEDVRDRRLRALARRPAFFERPARQAAGHRIAQATGTTDELPLPDRALDRDGERGHREGQDNPQGAATLS
jgi:hypothetical protein